MRGVDGEERMGGVMIIPSRQTKKNLFTQRRKGAKNGVRHVSGSLNRTGVRPHAIIEAADGAGRHALLAPLRLCVNKSFFFFGASAPLREQL